MIQPGDEVHTLIIYPDGSFKKTQGIYEGDHWCNELEMENPRIRLEDKTIVWGYQCWWGTKEQIENLMYQNGLSENETWWQ